MLYPESTIYSTSIVKCYYITCSHRFKRKAVSESKFENIIIFQLTREYSNDLSFSSQTFTFQKTVWPGSSTLPWYRILFVLSLFTFVLSHMSDFVVPSSSALLETKIWYAVWVLFSAKVPFWSGNSASIQDRRGFGSSTACGPSKYSTVRWTGYKDDAET